MALNKANSKSLRHIEGKTPFIVRAISIFPNINGIFPVIAITEEPDGHLHLF